MEIVITKQNLLESLVKVQGIVSKKSSLTVLSTILIKTVNKDKLTIVATNLSECIVHEVSCEVVIEGEVCVSGKILYDIINSLDKETSVSLKVEEQKMFVVAGKARFTIFTVPVAEFPKVDYNLSMENSFKIAPSVLRQMIKETDFSMSEDISRHNLNGIYLKAGVNNLLMVSTDGHRMSLSASELPKDLNNEFVKSGIIIPSRGIIEIKKMLSKTEQEVTIGVTFKQILLEVEQTKLLITLLDAVFPDYKSVIPVEECHPVTFNRRDFISVIRRVSVLSSIKNYGVIFDISAKQMNILTDNIEHGKANEVIDVVFTGTPLKIGVNSKYFLDVLNILEDDEFVLNIGATEYSALMIKKPTESKSTFIVMPIRL